MAPPDDDTQDIELRGTIESIEPTGTLGQHARWRVTLRVDEVLAGHVDGKTFSFTLHSPVKSGLAVGQQRTVRARRTADGYVVDGAQWRPGAGR